MSFKAALLSDIHGNSPALQAVLDDIQREQCSKVFMLGDIINGIDPHGCVQLLRTWSDTNRVELSCIKGNAEAYLVIPDRYSLPRKGDMWEMDFLNLIQWWQDHLSESDLEWVHSLPDTIHWNDAYLVHDSPMDRIAVQSRHDVQPQYREWMFHGKGIQPNMAEHEWDKLIEYMRAEDIAQVFCGHTHLPFHKQVGNHLVCNTGSAGMPLDGDPRPSWVMLTDDSSENQTVSIRRVTYDIGLMTQRIEQTPDYYDFKSPGFREAYQKMFLTGVTWQEHISDSE